MFIIFIGSPPVAGVDREDLESVTLSCTTTSLSSIQPSRVCLCASFCALREKLRVLQVERSWAQEGKVYLILFSLLIMHCQSEFQCIVEWMSGAVQERSRNQMFALRRVRARWRYWFQGRCARWWKSGTCHDIAGFRAGWWSLWRVSVWLGHRRKVVCIIHFPHTSDRSFLINGFKSCAPRAVPLAFKQDFVYDDACRFSAETKAYVIRKSNIQGL